jgi:hypothetical protein
MPRPAAFATVNDDMVEGFQRWFGRTACAATTEAREHASGGPVASIQPILAVCLDQAVAGGRGTGHCGSQPGMVLFKHLVEFQPARGVRSESGTSQPPH